MTIKICIANPKGGTAKTSTAVNLCCALAKEHYKIMLCDLDPQCSATVSLGYPQADDYHSLAGVLISDNDINPCVMHYETGNFDILPANADLTVVPVALYNKNDGIFKLKNALKNLEKDYDFIIFDTPAALNIITENALCAADKLVIPLYCDYFALDSMYYLLSKCQKLKDEGKSHIELLGIVRTLYDNTSPLSRYISHELKEQFGELLFSSLMSFNNRVSEAQATGVGIYFYDSSSISSRQAMLFAKELLKRLDI